MAVLYACGVILHLKYASYYNLYYCLHQYFYQGCLKFRPVVCSCGRLILFSCSKPITDIFIEWYSMTSICISIRFIARRHRWKIFTHRVFCRKSFWHGAIFTLLAALFLIIELLSTYLRKATHARSFCSSAAIDFKIYASFIVASQRHKILLCAINYFSEWSTLIDFIGHR